MKITGLVCAILSITWSVEPAPIQCSVLHTNDKCQYYEDMSVCIQESAFSKSGNKYDKLLILLNANSSNKLCGKERKWRSDDVMVIYFSFRVKQNRLYYLTSLEDDFTSSNADCKLKETLLFCLTDSVSTTRTTKNRPCETSINTILTTKEQTGVGLLFTYNIVYSGVSFDGPHLTSVSFDKNFVIRKIGFDTRGMIQSPCGTDDTLYFQ